MELFWKKLNENAIIPERKTELSAGFDLCACIDEDVVIHSGEIKKIGTGLAVEPSDKNVVLLVFARSGIASKNGVTLANSVGVIDSDYRGEIIVPLINNGKEDFTITKNMRMAQLVCMPVLFPESVEKTELSDTSRGTKGFGSTGV
ncbi:MAG: dUTP diphosphatase [Oscillospiraceae bacterium]|nr:dUTP diphosphatase [Oscillospiraceae bacterium]